MQYADYQVWRGWPENEIQGYATEIAKINRLSRREAQWMTRSMLQRAHDRRPFAPITSHEIEKLKEFETITAGKGLNKAIFTKRNIPKLLPWMRELRIIARKKYSRNPFIIHKSNIEQFIADARWVTNCLPIGPGLWLLNRHGPFEYGDPLWFLNEIETAYGNALRQSELGNAGAAAYHAYRLGSLKTQLSLDLRMGSEFEKYEAAHKGLANRTGARRVPDEALVEAFHRHRPNSKSMTAALRAVAQEYGISENTVRNAFPNSKPPKQ